MASHGSSTPAGATRTTEGGSGKMEAEGTALSTSISTANAQPKQQQHQQHDNGGIYILAQGVAYLQPPTKCMTALVQALTTTTTAYGDDDDNTAALLTICTCTVHRKDCWNCARPSATKWHGTLVSFMPTL